MPGLMALCHFCELHGPAVIMITQAIQDSKTPSSDHYEPDQKNYGCQKLFPENAPKTDRGGCEGCWSMETEANFIISNEHQGKQTLVSSQSIINQDLFNLIKHAVIRSISCEVSSNKEEPIIFADPKVSTVLANNFFLKDSRARGTQRYYSIIVINRDREHLISNWHHINKAVREIIVPLENMTNDKYIMETKTLKQKCKSLTENKIYDRNSSSKFARNLKELTMDPSIYETIHGQFVHILSFLEKSVKEKVLSGQPMKSSVIFPKAPLETLSKIIIQIGFPSFKILLYHLLSGKTLQIKSNLKHLSRSVGDSLCIMLPSNLSRSPSYFANLVVATSDMEDLAPQLTIHLEDSSNSLPQFGFKCCTGQGGFICTCCHQQRTSSFVAKYCKIFNNLTINKTIQEMSIRSFGEQILLHSRVFTQLNNPTEKRIFLTKHSFTASDEEILIFFQMFS